MKLSFKSKPKREQKRPVLLYVLRMQDVAKWPKHFLENMHLASMKR